MLLGLSDFDNKSYDRIKTVFFAFIVLLDEIQKKKLEDLEQLESTFIYLNHVIVDWFVKACRLTNIEVHWFTSEKPNC